MDSHDFDKLIQRILREARAPGSEHERLKSELAQWAQSKSYTKVFSRFQNGGEPDVLRATPDNAYLFVGDAKDAKNETPDNSETLQRIWNYVQEFTRLLGNPSYKGGYIAVATNSAQAAASWVIALNALARLAGITDGQGNGPTFKPIESKPGKTWIVYW
jgi:hypothetical protein